MHPRSPLRIVLAFTLSLVICGSVAAAGAADGSRATDELRITLVNLLQGLVDKGVLTREQAESIVRDAQTKAAAEAAAGAAQELAEQDAVRVPYVPEIVKDDIRRQVQADLAQQVTKEVIDAARDEGWGVPAGMPDWVKRMQWSGDLRLRAEFDEFDSSNSQGYYRDFQRINSAGGAAYAGLDGYLNTTVDRQRLRGRLRFGFDTLLGYGWSMGVRIAAGELQNPVSTNLTFGNGGARYALGLDLGWLDYTAISGTVRHTFSVTGGRQRNPFFTPSELVYDQDLNLDGVAASYKFGLQRNHPDTGYFYATAGAFPLQEIELSTKDKWLLGGQLGIDWRVEEGSRLRFGAGYYDFHHVVGRRNDFDSDLLDYTAPLYLNKGNTLFDIYEGPDLGANLLALAADYRVINYALAIDNRIGEAYKLSFAADYAQNIGYKESEVLERSRRFVPKRNVGYQGEVGFGTAKANQANAWQFALGYRYVQRDAVLDAFTDSDFHLGGTDAKGYYLRLDYSFTPKVAARARYLSANAIDDLPLGVDVILFDVTASF